MSKKRIGIDCNIYGSTLLGGITRQRFVEMLRLQHSYSIKIFYCEELITEIVKLSTVPYFQKKGITLEIVEDFIRFLKERSTKVVLKSNVEINRDKKDNYLLNLSLDANLDYLISGDKDLLDMKVFGKTKILTLKEFIETLTDLPF